MHCGANDKVNEQNEREHWGKQIVSSWAHPITIHGNTKWFLISLINTMIQRGNSCLVGVIRQRLCALQDDAAARFGQCQHVG